jgi:hypothetical protein
MPANEVRGRAEIRAAFKRVAKEYPKALGASMQDRAGELLEQTKVPVRRGNLQRSAFVSAVDDGPRGSSVRAGFHARYAVYVNGFTRFFTRALNGFKRGLLARVADGVADNLDRAPTGGTDGAPTKTKRPRPRHRRKRAEKGT